MLSTKEATDPIPPVLPFLTDHPTLMDLRKISDQLGTPSLQPPGRSQSCRPPQLRRRDERWAKNDPAKNGRGEEIMFKTGRDENEGVVFAIGSVFFRFCLKRDLNVFPTVDQIHRKKLGLHSKAMPCEARQLGQHLRRWSRISCLSLEDQPSKSEPRTNPPNSAFPQKIKERVPPSPPQESC